MADKAVPMIWGIHQEWNAASTPQETKDVAIGWDKLGDLAALQSSREVFKTAFAKTPVSPVPAAFIAVRRPCRTSLGCIHSPERGRLPLIRRYRSFGGISRCRA
jgi:hypothetical protein